MSGARSTRIALAVTGVCAIALGLRMAGISFGLPAVYNPDEVAIMNRALALGQNGLNPRNFLYPSLYFYVLFVWEGLWFVVGRTVGVFGSLADFEHAFFVDPSSLYVAGRVLSVLCGVATVWATWRLGTRLFGQRAGFAAAILLAVAPLAVRDAHYVKHDVPVTLLIVIAHLAAATTRENAAGRARWAAAGLAAGLAISTHYYAVFVLVPLGWLALAPARPGEAAHARFARIAQVGLAAAVAFVVTSPFLVAHPDAAIRDIVANRQIVLDRATTADGLFGSLLYYLGWLARDGMGVVATGLAAIGVLGTIRAGWRSTALTLAFPLTFVLFLGATYPASRYLNPVLPFVAILAGAGASWLMRGGQFRRAAAWGLLALATIEATAASVRTDRFVAEADTRTQALAWIEQHVPENTSMLIQPYSVPLRASRPALVEALTSHLGGTERASIKFQRQLALEPYPRPAYRTLYLGSGGLDTDKIYVDPAAFDVERSLAPLRRLSVTYVVLKRYNVPDNALVSLVRALERDGRLEVTFSPYGAASTTGDRAQVAPFLHNTDTRIHPALARPGPIVEIWKID